MPWNVWSLSRKSWVMLKSVNSKVAARQAIDTHLAGDYPDGDLEPRRVLPHLETNGTTLMQFKPEAVWRMAMADFDRRSGNAIADISEMKHYNFHRDHVRKAKSANDILRAAIAQPQRGRDSGKKITRLLYADIEHLKAALR